MMCLLQPVIPSSRHYQVISDHCVLTFTFKYRKHTLTQTLKPIQEPNKLPVQKRVNILIKGNLFSGVIVIFMPNYLTVKAGILPSN